MKLLSQTLIQPFYERNVITRPEFIIIWHNTSWGPYAQMVRLFLVFTCIWPEDVAKISKVQKAPRNVNPARAITWLVGVTIYCTIFK